MFLQFAGLSLFIHLAIILTAPLFNRLHGRKLQSAYQTYGKGGGVVTNQAVNKGISYLILIFMISYMSMLIGIAIATAVWVGLDEPQVQFYIYLFGLAVAHLGLVLMTVVALLGYYAVQISNPTKVLPLPALLHRGFHVAVDAVYESVIYISMKSTLAYNSITTPLARFTATRGALGSTASTQDDELSLGTTLMIRLSVLIVVGVALFGLPAWAHAQIVEPGFESQTVVADLTLATAVAFTPDGRMLIAEKSGTIKVVKNGVLLAQPLVTLTDINTFGDRGLLGLAVDPNFATNGYIYVSYTHENTPGLNVAGAKTGHIARLTVVGDTASESSKLVILGTVSGSADAPACSYFATTADCIASDSNSHSVGGLRFGPDGKLYATIGDGADFVAVDPRALRAQNLDSLNGKMLRINTDGTAPADNPYYNGSSTANRSKVYALGFRNAFRFSFHPTTGQLYAGDVGWSSWEEVNRVVPGANYGWPCREGNVATSYGCTPSSTTTNPLYTYAHNASGAGSITGGAFPSGGAYPVAYKDSLFIGDYAQMWMKRLVLNAAGTSVSSVQDFDSDIFPVDVVTGPDGNIYYIDIVFGTLNRLTHTSGNRRPVVAVSGTPTSGLAPLNVTFSSAGTSDPDGNPITYAWSFGDGGTSTLANPSHAYTTNGTYNAALVVTDSLGSSAAKSTTILVGNQAPTGAITSPASGSLYNVGENITVTGTGTDPETGTLAASAFAWTVLLHHNTHVHTLQTFTNTKSITFLADDHDASDVYLEIILTVTDAAGLKNTKSINMYLNNGVGSGNLVANASLEVEGAVASSPLNWYQGWYGVMDPVFTYPVAGLAGSKAAKVQVLSHTSGDAKWYFSPAFVTPGAQYTFSDLYTATVPTTLSAQFGRPDGTFQYQALGTLPATATAVRTSVNFTVPAGIETVTIFHQIGSVGTLIVDDYALGLTGSDVLPPSGTITSPAAGATVSGTTPIQVTATDNIGVASVQLVVNGTPTGVGDSEPAYVVNWDTASFANGTYSVFARITDTSGNVGDTAAISLTVNNSTGTTTAVNLFTNGNFETAGTGGNPQAWAPGGSGTHTAVYTYPVTGASGTGKAVQINVTKYTLSDTGDARWVHAAIPVEQGKRYTYETMYKATTISDVLGHYTFANGTHHYFGLIKEIPGTANWTHIEGSFVPPVGAVTVDFAQAISAEGNSLAIDDVKLYVSGTGTPSEINTPVVDFVSPSAGATLSGTVTLTATSSDDTAVVGVFFAVNGSPIGIEDTTAPYQATLNTASYPNGTYILKATTRDPFGNNSNKTITVTFNNSGTTTPPTGTSTNLVLNPSFETAGTGGNPANWNRGGWGTNTATYTYPATGSTGNGATVAITGFTNGDAKWYFDPVTITAGTQYTVGDKYKSTIGSEVLVQYTKTDGSFQYQFLDSLPTTGGAWQTYTKSITAPAGVNKLTLFHLIAANGSLTLDDATVTGPASTSTDTTLPTATVTAPAAGATITGTTTVTATAADNIGVAGVALLIDGVALGSEDTTAPYSFTWNSASIANGAHTIAVRARDAAGNLGTSALVNVTITNATSTPDTTKPVVSVTSPVASSTASGTVAVAVTATDNVGVVGVTLLIDGVAVGTEDTTAPYAFAWDSTTVTNGNHTIAARARDVAGNITTSVNVVVIVNNVVAPVSNNLVINGEFDTTGTGGNPANWNRGGWGTNTRTYNYPSVGRSGNGASVTISAYTNGDAKWYFDPVTITPGTQYLIRDNYNSTVSSEVLVQYTKTDGTFQYQSLNVLAGTGGTWQEYTKSIIAPAGVNKLTVFHLLAGNGTLAIDGVSVTGPSATTTDTVMPTVSLTAPTDGLTLTGTTTFTATASDNVAVASVYFLVDSNIVGAEDTTAPYALTFNTETLTNGTHVISARARDAAGNVGVSGSVTITTNNATSTDTTPPAHVIIMAPTVGATLTGTTSLTATTTNDAVGVTFLVDGVVVGVEDTTWQYGISWNSATVSNGTHVISARARDAAGNTITSGGVTVTINNLVAPVDNNLIINGDLETAGTGGNPANWNRGGWGTNNRTFTYPVAGQTGNGAEISMTTYTSGDAKWFFDPIAVNPGEQYTFSYAYKASVPSNISLRYTKTDGSFTYVGIGNPVAVANWTTNTFSFVPPDGVTAVTVMHILTGAGTLTIDNQALTSGNTNSFSRGKVTFSFDDGWIEHSTIAKPVLDAAGIDGTFYIISDYMTGANTEKVTNPGLETPGANGPAAWNQGGWGTNDRVFTYPATGVSGSAAEVTITNYTSGDAKWYFNPVAVTVEAQYTVGDSYRSTAPSEILLRYTKSDGSFQYEFLETLPSTGGAWQTYTHAVIIPADVTELTVFHILASVGTLAIDNVTVNSAQTYMNTSQVLSLQAAGHEIGSHTRTHPQLPTLTTAQKTNEIATSRQNLLNAGVNSVTTIAYPYGEYDNEVQTIAFDSGYTLGRSVERGYNDKQTDPFALKIQQVSRDDSVALMNSWIDQAAASNTWLIFMFHQISNDITADLGISPTDFQSVVNHAKTADVDIITVAQGSTLVN